jgi:ubiquitin-protein ligase
MVGRANTPHFRRLQADFEKMKKLAIRSPFVEIVKAEGNPPYEYQLRLTCRAVVNLNSNRAVFGNDHRLIVYLPNDYPKERPRFVFQTPIFHPNVHQTGQVCYGDEGDHGFAPSMGLDDLIVRIMQMMRFENFNPRSAFRLDAAQWAVNNQALFPIDKTQLLQDDLLSEIIISDDDGDDLDIRIF